MGTHRFLLGAIIALGLSSTVSHAQDCIWDPTRINGFDADISPQWNCAKAQVDDAWNRFNMDEGDWDDGFGYDTACNDDSPLKRTLNALVLLSFATTEAPSCNTDDPNFGNYAYCWAGDGLDELDGACGDGSERAWTSWTPGFQYTELYWPFFYGETVVQRAGTIVHEARHADGWCDHDDNDTCPRGGSCDPNFENGCVGVGSGDGPGANGIQVRWLQWFLNAAQPRFRIQGLLDSALGEANDILIGGFAVDPGFRLAADGTEMIKTTP